MQTCSSRSCCPGHIGSTSDARREPWVLLSHACIASHGSKEKGTWRGAERKRERGREKGNMEGSREEEGERGKRNRKREH